MSYLRKPSAEALAAAQSEQPDGGRFQEEHPALWEYLTYPCFEDGSPRQRATLLVCYEDGLLKACLNDRALERCMWAASDEWDDLLDGMERALVDGTAQWRRKPPFVPGAKKKS